MPLTLPGVLGRVFAAAGNLWQSTRLTGDTFQRHISFGDGSDYTGDGTQDLTSSKVTLYGTPTKYIKMKLNSIGLVISGINDGNLKTLQEWHDYLENPIMSVGQVGGLWLNDNFKQAFGIFGPYNVQSDIYGHLQLGNQSCIRCSPGPPGNVMNYCDATGELFQRSRAGVQGLWTATNATWAAFNMGPGLAPTGFSDARQWTAVGAGNVVSTTATGLAGYPVSSGVFIAAMCATMSKTVARSKQLALLFYNAAGTVIGSAVPGAAAVDSTTFWTRYDVQTVTPAGTAFCALQLTVTGAAAAGEIHYDTLAGIWPGLTTSQVTQWNPPFVYRQDAFLPAASAVTGCTGSGVSPIVITVGANHPFKVGDTVTTLSIGGNAAANQVNAVVTAITGTTFTLAGTGSGNYTSGGTATMIFSALGLYDGANPGDVMIRSDGPANVVQRFATNGVGGVPSKQKWTGDPRLTSNPARLNWYGGTYIVQGATFNADYTLPSVVMGMLHNNPEDSINRGVLSAKLLDDSAGAAQAGGICTLLQSVKKKTTGQPYVSKDGVFVFFWGLWDMAQITSGQGAPVMTRMTGPGTSNNNGALTHCLRDAICRARASVILEETAGAFVMSGGASSGGGNNFASGGATPGTGGAYWSFSTATNSFTFTIPADFEGGGVAFSFIAPEGAFGGTVTWTGTMFSTGGIANPGPTLISVTTDSPSRGKVCVRFKGLTAANASQTVIGTISSLDAGGSINLDCAYIEGTNPNLVFVCGSPRLLNAAAYVAAGGAGSYWNGNAGATGDADILALNVSLRSLVAEFDSAVAYVDMDGAIQQYPNFYAAADSTRFDESGVQAMAAKFVDTLNATLPLVDFRAINHDFHDTTIVPIGGPFTKQGPLAITTGTSRFYADDDWYITSVRASVNTAPTGASVVVDVLKNGSTIFTTAANRPTITTGTNTAVSAASPDIRFLIPGDYLTVNVSAVGGTFPGADLTVNVLGRKIPVP